MAQRGEGGSNFRYPKNGGIVAHIRIPSITIRPGYAPTTTSDSSSISPATSAPRSPPPPNNPPQPAQRHQPQKKHAKDSQDIRDTFTKLDVASKTLLYEANQLLRVFRGKEVQDLDWVTDQRKMYDLMAQIKQQLDEMMEISEDMNAVKDQKISSPRLIDQAKACSLTVDNVKTSLRQLQRDFQGAITTKERQDLFTLSRSPFENDGTRRRGAGAAEISSGATESMIHSRRILLETVQRSAGTIGTLANSSSSIQDNQEELKSQSSLISVSKKLLTKYGRREFTDKILICLALVFFLACVAYVVQKRIF